MRSQTRLLMIVILLILRNGITLNAQFFTSGEPPASVRYSQIKSDNFRLIYPDSFEKAALELAIALEKSWHLTGHTLNHQPRSVPVVVHNQNTRSNGMVMWAPRRMELLSTPPQESRGIDWLAHLAVHEQRHVVQVDKLDRGMTSILGIFLGQQAPGIAVGRLPLWLLEGDAVAAETALTSAGRGRRASFGMPLRAHLANAENVWSYDKFLFGSYRDNVPDHYRYGYYMVASLRGEYGPEIWEKVFAGTGNMPLHPAPFASALKKQTGQRPGAVHRQVMEKLRVEWDSVWSGYTVAGHDVINLRTEKTYHSYRYPVWDTDTSVISLLTGMAVTNRLVRHVKGGGMEIIHYPGPLSSPAVSYSNGRIVWSEHQPDIRWGQRVYSVVAFYDYETGKPGYLTAGSRYFAPAFDPSGKYIAVIEIGLDNSEKVAILDASTGEAETSFRVPGGLAVRSPVYSGCGMKIFIAATGSQGNSIMAIDNATGEWTEIYGPTYANISGLFVAGNMICFSSDLQGVDNMFAFDIDSGQQYRLTGSRFGASDGALSPSGDQLVWSDYTAAGFDLAFSSFVTGTSGRYDVTSYADNYPEMLSAGELSTMDEVTLPGMDLEPVPYRRWTGMFNFHSWSPFWLDYFEPANNITPVFPGITLLSQSLLGTSNTLVGYSREEGNNIIHGRHIWRGWFPVIEAGFSYGQEPHIHGNEGSNYPAGNDGNDANPQPGMDKTGLLRFDARISVPLNFSRGGRLRGVRPAAGIVYDRYRDSQYGAPTEIRGATILETDMLAYSYARRSIRDLVPGKGGIIRWQSRYAITGETPSTGIFMAGGSLFRSLPNHIGFRFDATVQWQTDGYAGFNSIAAFPRGYPREATGQLRLLRATMLAPVAYPDFDLPGLLYIKRIHLQLFADSGINRTRIPGGGTGAWESEKLFSWGVEFTAETHLFRLLFPFEISLGAARIPSRNYNTFLFSIGINPFG